MLKKRISLIYVFAILIFLVNCSFFQKKVYALIETVGSTELGSEKRPLPHEPYIDSVTRKLSRGVTNVAFGWMEVFQQMSREYHKDERSNEYLRPLVYGTNKGRTRVIGRLFVGLYEIVTFWIPQQPIIEPEFVVAFQGSDVQRYDE